MRPQSYDDLPKPDHIFVVVGFPKSGNTWMSRLIGEVLNSPVGGYMTANPLCTEGGDRPGSYYITQIHAHPGVLQDVDYAIYDPHTINVAAWRGEKIVHIKRDPRDVAVSAMFYWKRKDIPDVIKAMAIGANPFGATGPLVDYVTEWEEQTIPVAQIMYEDLRRYPRTTLGDMFDFFGFGNSVTKKMINDAILAQDFSLKKEQIGKDGEHRPYGPGIQLRNLRKGIIGDWMNHFTRKDGELFHEHFGEYLIRQGYEKEPYWWESLPEQRDRGVAG